MMRLGELCLHPVTRSYIAGYVRRAEGNLLLTGPSGSGKITLATATASAITQDSVGAVYTIGPEKNLITIDMIRGIKDFFRLKSFTVEQKQVVVIDGAHLMNVEAQNSLLKILEETPKNCYIILTADTTSTLLTTILSRCLHHPLRLPSHENLMSYLGARYPSTQVASVLVMTGNLIGLASDVLSGNESLLSKGIARAKNFLALSTFDRLLWIDKEGKNDTHLFILGLKTVAVASIEKQGSKNTSKWQIVARACVDAEKLLKENISRKLVLTQLILRLYQ